VASPRYQVAFAPAAERQLRKLAREVQVRIVAAAESLQVNPRPRGVVKLEGSDGFYRIRVGDWRIVYQIEDERLIVLVLRIGHRRDVYRKGG
jgi:mRNA interferase RelE/StbE